MTRPFLLLLLLALCAAPAMGAVSPIKTDFQDYTAVTGNPVTQSDWTISSNSGMISFSSPDTYGHVNIAYPSTAYFNYGWITNVNSNVFTYASYTTYTNNAGASTTNTIFLYDVGGNLMYTSPAFATSPTTPQRIECIISGGTAKIYNNGALQATSGILSVNPYRIAIQIVSSTAGITSYIDDIIIGYSDDSTIIGPPPSNWFILYDSLAPASTGLYQTNATLGGNPILKNSNYFGTSYGRGTSAATTLQLINPIGAVVKSYPVANYSCQAALPIADLYQDGVIMPGYWTVQLADSPLAQKHFWVLSGTAAVAMDKTSYLVGDTGIATYSIPSAYWTPATYSYKLRVVDIYGTKLQEYNIASAASSQYVSFTTADGAGVRFIEIVRIKTSDSTESIIGYTSTTVYEYLGFNIHTYDGATALALPSVPYNITQGSIIVTGNTSSVDGNASVSGFGTGALLTYTFNKTGYRTRTYSFTPLATGTKTLDMPLYPSAPSVSNVTIGGAVYDSVYGSAIPSATVTATNGTTISTTANIRGGYTIPGLTAGKCYAMGATKTGFLFAAPMAPVCVVAA